VFQQNTLAMYNYKLTISCEVSLPRGTRNKVHGILIQNLCAASLPDIYALADEIILAAFDDEDTKVLSISLQESLKPE